MPLEGVKKQIRDLGWFSKQLADISKYKLNVPNKKKYRYRYL